MKRYYVQIYGPHTSGTFGTDSLVVESPRDVRDIEGVLMITTAAREAGVVTLSSGVTREVKARSSEIVVYPSGEWWKIRIGEILPKGES